MNSKIKTPHVLGALIATYFISCQADTPTPTTQVPKTRNLLPQSLKTKVKSRGGNLLQLQVKPMKELRKKLDSLKNPKLKKRTTPIAKHFGINALGPIDCTGDVCDYQEIGDWDKYYTWSNYYDEIYNSSEFEHIWGSQYQTPESQNANGDLLCAYDVQDYCLNTGPDCKTQINELSFYGCVCPQQYNDSPPNYVEDPGNCSGEATGNDCDVFWEKYNSCYDAGGHPHVNFDTCQFSYCEGVEAEDQFCQTYTVGGQTKESCTTCPDGQELFYKDGVPVACRPFSNSQMFRVKGEQPPYGRDINNDFCK